MQEKLNSFCVIFNWHNVILAKFLNASIFSRCYSQIGDNLAGFIVTFLSFSLQTSVAVTFADNPLKENPDITKTSQKILITHMLWCP